MKKLFLVAATLIFGGYLQADITELARKAKMAAEEFIREGKFSKEAVFAGTEFIEEGVKLIGPAKVYPKDTKISFEMKNKSKKPVFFKVGNEDGIFEKDDMDIFKAPEGKTIGLPVSIEKDSTVMIWTKAEPGAGDEPEMAFSIAADKTMYLTWDGSTVRPQTGPAMGKLGKTDTGKSLGKNVKPSDIKKL